MNVSNSESFDSAPFVPNVPMIFLIHGYTGWKDYAPNPEIRPCNKYWFIFSCVENYRKYDFFSVYFENGEYNVISVDYNPLVREPCYPAAAGNVPLIGMCVAQMIDYLVEERNIPLDNFHIVGFSLGAQVSGELSNWLKSGRLPRITGNKLINKTY